MLTKLEQLLKIASLTKAFNDEIKFELETIEIKTIEEKKLFNKIKNLLKD